MRYASFVMLDSPVVIVTGAARGLGLAISEMFLDAGAAAVVGVDVLPFDSALRTLGTAGFELSRFVPVHADVTNEKDIESVIRAGKGFGAINVLVNNAGITRDRSFLKMPPADWNAVLEVNLKGPICLSEAVIETWQAEEFAMKGRMVICNIASIIGLVGNFGQANYATAKGGLIGFTEALANRLGPQGGRAFAIAPGFLKTEMTKAMPAEALSRAAGANPMHELGDPAAIAAWSVFGCAPAGAFLNGACLTVDGGHTCMMPLASAAA